MLLSQAHTQTLLYIHTHTHIENEYSSGFQPDLAWPCVSCIMHLVHLPVSMCRCVFSTCVCVRSSVSQCLSHPPSLAIWLLTTEGKGEGSADKEAECADRSIQRQKK